MYLSFLLIWLKKENEAGAGFDYVSRSGLIVNTFRRTDKKKENLLWKTSSFRHGAKKKVAKAQGVIFFFIKLCISLSKKLLRTLDLHSQFLPGVTVFFLLQLLFSLWQAIHFNSGKALYLLPHWSNKEQVWISVVRVVYPANGLAWMVTSFIRLSVSGRNVFSFTGSFSSSSSVSRPSIILQVNRREEIKGKEN